MGSTGILTASYTRLAEAQLWCQEWSSLLESSVEQNSALKLQAVADSSVLILQLGIRTLLSDLAAHYKLTLDYDLTFEKMFGVFTELEMMPPEVNYTRELFKSGWIQKLLLIASSLSSVKALQPVQGLMPDPLHLQSQALSSYPTQLEVEKICQQFKELLDFCAESLIEF